VLDVPPSERKSCFSLAAMGCQTRMKDWKAALRGDWEEHVIPITMMGMQGQTVVGSMVGLMQSVYLVQFGARASILSKYLALTVPVNFLASVLAVSGLLSSQLRNSFALNVFGCIISLIASVALTFPPQVYGDGAAQSDFLSHYFGILFIISNIGAKFRDYPVMLAKLFLLGSTRTRARAQAYTSIFDVMIGNGLNGALLLAILAQPTPTLRTALVVLMSATTVVSIRGAFSLRTLQHRRGALPLPRVEPEAEVATSEAIGSRVDCWDGEDEERQLQLRPSSSLKKLQQQQQQQRSDEQADAKDLHQQSEPKEQQQQQQQKVQHGKKRAPTEERPSIVLPMEIREATPSEVDLSTNRHSEESASLLLGETSTLTLICDIMKLSLIRQVWQLIIIDWSVGFIFTLNSQAAGAIYWSSVVGVSDKMRSVFIGAESALGGGVLGFFASLYCAHIYQTRTEVTKGLSNLVAIAASLAAMSLFFFGKNAIIALLAISGLYLYYFVFAWTNIEFLNLLDSLRACYLHDSPFLYVCLLKDIIGGILNNLRSALLMAALAATGFYEPDCRLLCEGHQPSEMQKCVDDCHVKAHESITDATVLTVRMLYVLVTPGAYLLACALMRGYSRLTASIPKLHSSPTVRNRSPG